MKFVKLFVISFCTRTHPPTHTHRQGSSYLSFMVWDNSGLCAVREWPALFCCRMCVLCLWGCVSFVAESMDTLARIAFQMRKNGMYGNTMNDVLLSEGFSLWVVKPPSLNPWAQQSDSRKQHEICLHVCVFVLRPPLTLGSHTLTLFTHTWR